MRAHRAKKKMNNITLDEIVSIIKEKSDIAVFIHQRPDGDAIGSAFALKHAFPEKNIAVVCPDAIPDRLKFISCGEDTVSPDSLHFVPELKISLDAAADHLLGEDTVQKAGGIDIKVDHHASGNDFANRCYVDSKSASCSEIVFEILSLAGSINEAAANALYAGIVSDTGCFRYSNTTPKTHRITAELCEKYPVDFAEINTRLFQTKTHTEIAAAKYAYNNLQLHRNGTVASLIFTNEAKERLGLCASDISSVNDIPRTVDGVDLGIVITQNSDKPEIFKISTRSNRYTDANALCALFGGGGHLRAAGGQITAASPEEALQTIISKTLEFLGDEND